MYEEEWISIFSGEAAPRLNTLFEEDRDQLPQNLELLLRRLRESEPSDLPLGA